MLKNVIAVLLVLLLAACAERDEIVLLADDDGSIGRIALNPGGDEVVIADAYQRARVGKGGKATVDRTDAEAVRRDYGAAIGAMPQPPMRFTLRYEFGSDVVAAESLALIPRIATAIEEHAPADVVIVGHTDTVGKAEFNDDLSLRRAEAVREQLVAAGLTVGRIELWGRGEREPIEPGEERPSEINRRAEVIVR